MSSTALNGRRICERSHAVTRNRLSIPIIALVIAAAIVAVVLTTGSSAKKPAPAVAASSAISVRQTSFGKALTDANGRTLYLFAADRPNVSRLSAAGRAFWPPFTSSAKPSATGGAQAGAIGSVAGTTGARQVTYNGHPLYYFVGDRTPGQTAGQALNQFGARWYVVSPSGGAITSTSASTASNSSTGGATGYGY
jgi:predicted lipoprotein with Yx(FWY)xxD motif